MKDISLLLQKGDLRPKERILLLVKNHITEERTGKAILTEADEHALSAGWTPKNSTEAQEYNRYNKAWQIEGGMRLDMQTAYLNAVISLLRASRLVDYAMWTDYRDTNKGYAKTYNSFGTETDENEALTLILKNTGLEFDCVVYRSAFESLSDELKKDLEALYPDIKTERGYLDQEETIASLLDGKSRLTTEAKETLSDLIVEEAHNRYFASFEEKDLESQEWYFNRYYADLPLLEVAKRWADDNKIYEQKETDELEKKETYELCRILAEKMGEYAVKHGTGVRELLRKTVRAWLDDGLYVDDFAPLCRSKRKETCNDADTTLPHNQVFAEWIKAKTKAQATVQGLVDAGKLTVTERSRSFLKVTETLKILTGESLYALESDLAFITDLKKQADDMKPLGSLVLFLRQRDFVKEYATLLGFAEIFVKLSRIYEIDMGYKAQGFILGFEKEIELLNMELRRIEDRIEDAVHLRHGGTFLIEVFIDDMLFSLKGAKPFMDEAVEHYSGEFQKILGDEFQ